jgi:hypothetical protein
MVGFSWSKQHVVDVQHHGCPGTRREEIFSLDGGCGPERSWWRRHPSPGQGPDTQPGRRRGTSPGRDSTSFRPPATNQKAKAVVLDPAEMSIFPERQGWHVEGSVAYFMR